MSEELNESLTEQPDTQDAELQPADAEAAQEPAEEPVEEPKVFDLTYVQKLRDESAKYRQRAAKADELGQRLHTALVSASGRLQDASDLPFNPEHLEAPEALEQAIEALLAAKPHLASRKPSGFIPQGATAVSAAPSLAGILRRNAGL